MMRTLFKTDLGQVLAIEEAVHVSPWTEETFRACFMSGHFGWVVEAHKKVVGFILISLTPEECHILNIGIAREYQHQGFGSRLLQHALNHAKRQGIGIAYLEVRRSNTRAIAMYKKMRFHLIGERKSYYPTSFGFEDALIFAKSLYDNER